MKGQPHITFKVERYQSLKDDASVYWRLLYESQSIQNTFGRIQFKDGEIQQVVKVPLDNLTHEKPTRIELFNPTNVYKLGIMKMTNISLVCKYFTCIIFDDFAKNMFLKCSLLHYYHCKAFWRSIKIARSSVWYLLHAVWI